MSDWLSPQEREEFRAYNEKRYKEQHGACLAEITQLRGNLSLAEEGLANYQQETQELRKLLARAVDIMSTLHRSIEPMEDDPELAGRVSPAAMRAFVDSLAQIDRERCSRSPQTGK